MTFFTFKKRIPVYHMTSSENARQILKEGLLPMKNSERPQSMRFVDAIFSEIGEKEFEIEKGREQIFAWPLISKIRRDIGRARDKWGEQVVLELSIEPEKVIVTHQDCTSVAREIILSAIRTLHVASAEEDRSVGHPFPGHFISNIEGDVLWSLRNCEQKSPAFQEFFKKISEEHQRLELLARTYWQLRTPIKGFDENKMRQMYTQLLNKVSEYPSLQIMLRRGGDYTNTETIIFADRIPKRKIKVVDI